MPATDRLGCEHADHRERTESKVPRMRLEELKSSRSKPGSQGSLICSKCGEKNSEDGRICKKCKQGLYVNCMVCGQENLRARTKCSSCSHHLRNTLFRRFKRFVFDEHGMLILKVCLVVVVSVVATKVILKLAEVDGPESAPKKGHAGEVAGVPAVPAAPTVPPPATPAAVEPPAKPAAKNPAAKNPAKPGANKPAGTAAAPRPTTTPAPTPATAAPVVAAAKPVQPGSPTPAKPGLNRPLTPEEEIMDGWRARYSDVTIENGIVTMVGKKLGPKALELNVSGPFLAFSGGKREGPGVIKFRIRSAAGGPGKIETLPGGLETPPNEIRSMPFVTSGGEWQEISVMLAQSGPIGMMRMYLPAQKQPVQVDWIELVSNGKYKRWDF